MKTLKLIHGYEIEIPDKKDIEKLLKLYKDRLPLYFTSREEKSSKVNNWELVRKLVPNRLPKMPIELFTMDDDESENTLNKMYVH